MKGRRCPRRRAAVDRAVALCCLPDRVVLVEAAPGRGSPRVTACAIEAPLAAEGREGAGRGGSPELLAGLVTRLGLRGRRAVLVLEAEHTVARFWKAPPVSDREQLACLALEADKWLPAAAAVPWTGVAARTPSRAAPADASEGAPEEENAIAVAAPAGTVGPLLRAAADAGLEPWGVTVPPLALEGLLAAGEASAERVAAAIHIGAQKSWLVVTRGGALLMAREIEVAREGLLSALALVSVEGHGTVRLGRDEAEALLGRFGVVSEDEPIGMANERLPLESLKFALRPALERLASSIGRSLDFCREQFFIEIPDTIHLTGVGAGVPGLDAWLSSHLLVRLVRGVPWQGRADVTADGAAAWEACPELVAVAAGAALGALGGRALPARAEQYGLPRWVSLPARRLAAAVAAAAALLWFAAGWQADRAEGRAVSRAAELAAGTSELAAARARYRLQDATRLEQALVARHARGNIRVDGILKALSQAVPPEVTLSQLSLPGLNGTLLDLGGTPVDAAAAGGVAGAGGADGGPAKDGVLTLRGEVHTDRERLETALSRLIVQLERSPYFDNVNFVESAEDGEGVSSFRLCCRIHQGLRWERPPQVAVGP